MIIALVLAGGHGKRFGRTDRPKQFLLLHERPVFMHALDIYLRPGCADHVVLVVHPDYLDEVHDMLIAEGRQESVLLTAGGRTRRDSIVAGRLAALRAWNLMPADLLILHNAASPNTPPATVKSCLQAAETADVAQACFPQTRTQFEVNGDRIVASPDRDGLVISCDPTVFRAGALERVIEQFDKRGDDRESTTDIALDLGMSLRQVPCSDANIKITSPWDLAAVESAMGQSSADHHDKARSASD